MIKFSVRKPYTILVMVIMVLVLGVVSVLGMTIDLLPSMSLPYIMVITPYPGASPERVEAMVSEPLENALGTVSHVKNVTSISAENYSMVQLEFEDGTDMDSATVKVSSAVQQASITLPDDCGTPSLLEISMDMIATMYLAVSRDGDDIYQLTDRVRTDIIPYLQRVEGVASVTGVGLVERTVQVELSQDKIDRLNDKILDKTMEGLEEARAQLDEAIAQVESGQEMLTTQENSFGRQVAQGLTTTAQQPVNNARQRLEDQLNESVEALRDFADRVEDLEAELTEIGRQVDAQRGEIQGGASQINAGMAEATRRVEDAVATYQLARTDYETTMQAVTAAGEDVTEAQLTAYNQAVAALQLATTDLQAAQAGLEEAAATSQQGLEAGAETLAQADLGPILRDLTDEITETVREMDGSTITTMLGGVTRIRESLVSLQSVLNQVESELSANMPAQGSGVATIQSLQQELASLRTQLDQIPSAVTALENAIAAITQGQLDAAVGFSTATTQLADARAALSQAEAQYETMREQALSQANLDSLISAQTLSQLIYAQNFSMPAGYLDDKDDHAWLLKIGDPYEDEEEIAGVLLADVEGIGTIRLTDVADITVIDNAEDSYAKLNGQDAIALAVYKGSTSGTNQVSREINASLEELMEKDPELHVIPLMDQGSYITLIVQDILTSMALGALLAILVLAMFLKDVRPTLMVGISIPLSVLFTLVLMYFTGLTLNIMTLSGLALGIGMLVDNSIVVMENILRLRSRGIQPGRASVQGAKQVFGAVVASTLTTVCVFLPMVFTTGTVRELLVPMALSITYCLTASLIVAMTVIPASASALLRNLKAPKEGIYARIQEKYAQFLRYCLHHKAAPLGVSIALLALSVIWLIRIGIIMLPEMTSDNIQVMVDTHETTDRAVSDARVDEIMEAVETVEGIGNAGFMDAAAMTGLISSVAGDSTEFGQYMGYVTLAPGTRLSDVPQIIEDIEKATEGSEATVTVTSGSMQDLSGFTSTGLSMNVYGIDLKEMERISEELMGVVEGVEGFDSISNGAEDNEPALQLVIDRDKAMQEGLTVAQIYMMIAQRMATSVNATTVTMNGSNLAVIILDETDPLTRENLLDMELTTQGSGASAMSMPSMSGMGAASGMSGMGGMGSMGSAGSMGMSMGAMSGMSGMSASSGMTGMSGDMASLFGGAATQDVNATAEEEESEAAEEEPLRLGDIAYLEETDSPSTINRENQTRYVTVSASTKPGYNTTLLTRKMQGELDRFRSTLPDGYSVSMGGETLQVSKMVSEMSKLMLLAFIFIYLVMVAQFQSLKSPFIIMFTIPLAFTGGMLGLIFSGQQLSMLSIMGFLVLMGTVVNNGIVFVDYANQLRIGGLDREEALVATGKTRMRPILMTALTTILAMGQMIFGSGMGAQLSRGMAIVIASGLIYSTLMTLIIIPVLYDLFFKEKPLNVDVGDDLEEVPDDAAEYLSQTS